MRIDLGKWRQRITLRGALIGYVILPLILAIAVLGALLLNTFENRVEERMKEDVQLIARALEEPVQRALERGREGSLRSALESAIGINRVYGAYVYGPQGEMIASMGAANLTPDRGRLSMLAGEETPRDVYEEISGRNVYSYFMPLTTSGQRSVGLLQITRRERDIRASVSGLRAQVAGFSAIAVFFVAAMVLIGHRGAVGRYLASFQDSMRRIEKGDIDYRMRLEGPREIADVSHAFNTMLDGLERAEEEIAQRRAAERALHAKLRHAEKLAALGTLSAGVAHELGTPLSVIEGRAHRMLRSEDLPPEAARSFQEIREQVHRMERIIRQLLDFSRSSSMQRIPVKPALVVEAAVSSVQEEAARRCVTIRVNGSDVAEQAELDAVRVEQALTNLLKNAIDASRRGTIHVTYEKDGDELRLAVEDDGPGIDDELAQHIFEPFFTTKPVGEGTGLGLAVVHGIVEEHGGSIEVDRSEFGGARFTVRLPMRDAWPASASTATRTHKRADGPAGLDDGPSRRTDDDTPQIT